MSNDKMLKRILEPTAPQLSDAAAARLESRVNEALTGTGKRRFSFGLALPLVAVPTLLIAMLLFWNLPAHRDFDVADYPLMNEEEFVTALMSLDPDNSGLTTIFDDEPSQTDTSGWTDADWSAYKSELEDFSLTDMGGI
jgi:hypothetical protein